MCVCVWTVVAVMSMSGIRHLPALTVIYDIGRAEESQHAERVTRWGCGCGRCKQRSRKHAKNTQKKQKQFQQELKQDHEQKRLTKAERASS